MTRDPQAAEVGGEYTLNFAMVYHTKRSVQFTERP